MKLVVIESPLGAPDRLLIEDNKRYARTCVRDSLRRGEAPYASHLFFDHPEILDDLKPEEREKGMKAGFAWGRAAETVAIYVDRGISQGMMLGFERGIENGAEIVVRSVVTGDEMVVPLTIELMGTWLGEEAQKRNRASLLQAAGCVIGRASSVASCEPEPTPRTLPGLSD